MVKLRLTKNSKLGYMKNLFTLFIVCVVTTASAQNDFPVNKAFSHEVVTSEITLPWGIEFLPNGDMLVTDKSGKLYRVAGKKVTTISGVPEVYFENQGGLMDITLHPDYQNNGWIYISYSKGGRKDSKGTELSTTAIARAKLDGDQLVNLQEVFVAEPWEPKKGHYGSRIVFDKEGYMFFSVGERQNRDNNPQTLRNHLGKIHRTFDDGSVPDDNPFRSSPIAMPSIYSYGHRNPQGLVISPDGTIWETEHGPKGGDELNIIEPGKNYGWPVISYGINYDGTSFTELTAKEGMEQPVNYWVPSIAPCGMEWVTSNKYGDLQGDILVGSLSFQYVNRCVMENGKVVKEEKLLEGVGRVRAIEEAPDGTIYVGVENIGIVRLVRK